MSLKTLPFRESGSFLSRPILLQTHRPAPGHDDVIEHLDAQRLAGFLQATSDGKVFVAGRGVAARMIVYQDDGFSGVLDGRAIDFARVYEAAVETAHADLMRAHDC